MILHINRSDRTGGAAIAAFRLHNAMINAGIDSKYFVQERTINDRDDICSITKFQLNIKKLFNALLEKITTYNMRGLSTLFSSFRYGIDITGREEVKNADIIYLHWINASFISLNILKKLLKTGKPVFWFMHDMFPITGGCHYSLVCDKYKKQCSNCPCSKKNHSVLSSNNFKKKQKAYKKYTNLHFIAPSKWLYECAKESVLTRNSNIYHIPNLLGSSVFRPFDKKTARQFLSIKSNTKIIGCGADTFLTNIYKGWSYLKNALEILSKDKNVKNFEIELLVFGSNYNKEIADTIPFNVYFLGHLHDEYSLSLVYNSLDLFVIPSLAENFSNTIIESLSCNTPVVGFNVGGIPDIINNDTGYLAEYRNSEDLAHGMASLLCNPKNDVHKYILQYNPEFIIEKHKKIWKEHSSYK